MSLSEAPTLMQVHDIKRVRNEWSWKAAAALKIADTEEKTDKVKQNIEVWKLNCELFV